MRWFSRKRPHREAVQAEFKKAIDALQSAKKSIRMEVGHSINIANSALEVSHGGVNGFKRLKRGDQLTYLDKLRSFEAKLGEETPFSGLGVGLFKIWLTAVIEDDAELIEKFGSDLSDLSKDGDLHTPSHTDEVQTETKAKSAVELVLEARAKLRAEGRQPKKRLKPKSQ